MCRSASAPLRTRAARRPGRSGPGTPRRPAGGRWWDRTPRSRGCRRRWEETSAGGWASSCSLELVGVAGVEDVGGLDRLGNQAGLGEGIGLLLLLVDDVLVDRYVGRLEPVEGLRHDL